MTELDKDGDPMDMQDLRDAVIEAARAYTNADVQTYDDLRNALNDAVEALERVEKGKM